MLASGLRDSFAIEDFGEWLFCANLLLIFALRRTSRPFGIALMALAMVVVFCQIFTWLATYISPSGFQPRFLFFLMSPHYWNVTHEIDSIGKVALSSTELPILSLFHLAAYGLGLLTFFFWSCLGFDRLSGRTIQRKGFRISSWLFGDG